MEGGYGFLLDLALILLSTKLLGLLTQRFQLPQVVGALLAGLILGPAVLNVIQETEFIKDTAEIGVIVMMFCAGMETDVNELKHSGKAAFIIALIGVLVPIGGGFALAYFFNQPGVIESDATTPVFLQNMFIGVILTATSVSISVETLKELGKLKTRSGNAILGAAIIDDVLGIIALTIISSMADSSVSIGIVLLQILGFFVFVAVAGFLFYKFYIHWVVKAEKGMHRHVIIAFVFCLLMSFVAEVAFGVADITGAFCAGVIISMTQRSQYLNSKFDVLSYAYLSPPVLCQHWPAGDPACHDPGHRLVLGSAHCGGGAHQGGGLRPGRQAVPLPELPGGPHWRGHDFPGRGGPDCGQQGHGPGADGQ